MNICLIFNERPVLNRLRPVRTSNRSRPVLTGFLRSLIGPVRFFEVLGLWWTGLSLGLSPWRSKTETGPDFQSLGNGEGASWVVVILSSYGLLFHFNAASFSCVLPPSLPFVIMHCTIHVFPISRLIVYVTHFFYLDTCTYISNDPYTSMDS